MLNENSCKDSEVIRYINIQRKIVIMGDTRLNCSHQREKGGICIKIPLTIENVK